MKLCQGCGQLLAEDISTCPVCGNEVAEGRKTIDDYRILEVLHEGYATTLCRAVKEDTEESVMIRIFSPLAGVDEKIAERLKNELEELKKLPENYFVRHFEIRRSSDGLWYRVSEWLDAENWGNLIASGVFQDYRVAFQLFYRIASIHPGNSGGPVIDLRGKVIGIASRVALDWIAGPVPVAAPLSDMGMVLPINKAAGFLQEIKAGKVKWNGVLDLSVNAKIKKILDLADKRRWAEAQSLADQELKTSVDPTLLLTAAMIHFCADDREKAWILFEKALSMDEKNDQARLMLFLIERLADQSTASPYGRDLLAPLQAKLGQDSLAPKTKRALLEQVLNIDPANGDLLVEMVFYCAMEDDWDSALEYVQRFLLLDGRENAGRLRVGLLKAVIFHNLGRKEAALAELDNFLNNTEDAWYRSIAECLLDQEKEKTLAQKAGESPEYLLTGHIAIAFWAEGNGDKVKAIDHYREALGSYMDDMIEYVFAVERIKRLRQPSQ